MRETARLLPLLKNLLGSLTCSLALTAATAGAAAAQPFDAWFSASPSATGFIEVPHTAALNPAGAFTFEAWVAISNSAPGSTCRSIAGKNYIQAWWVGQCDVGGQPTLRSYLKGETSQRNGGIIPRGEWTHVAVVFNGSDRLHYINGELAASFPETGPLPGSSSAMRIFSDVSHQHTPQGQIDEVRLWNVARSTAQIRAFLNVRVSTPQPGLIGVWTMNAGADDIIAGRDGSVTSGGVGFLNFPVAADCGATTVSTLCLHDRFLISAEWRTNPTPGTPADGDAAVVAADSGSGIFWFFAPNNWEIMIKAIDGCGLNNRWWIFSAATTNVFYRMTVTDVHGEQKIYFNYPGPPAPAVTDVNAMATCP